MDISLCRSAGKIWPFWLVFRDAAFKKVRSFITILYENDVFCHVSNVRHMLLDDLFVIFIEFKWVHSSYYLMFASTDETF